MKIDQKPGNEIRQNLGKANDGQWSLQWSEVPIPFEQDLMGRTPKK